MAAAVFGHCTSTCTLPLCRTNSHRLSTAKIHLPHVISVQPCRRYQRSHSSRLYPAVHATETAEVSTALATLPEAKLSSEARKVTDFAIKFAATSEVYEVHSWHVVMGLLQIKEGIAAEVLKEQGLTNFNEAFLEVLYCLKMADATEPKGFQGTVGFTKRAMHVINHAWWTARCLGHTHADTEHILAALTFYEVIQELFPDLDLTEDTIWAKINSKWEKQGMSTNKKLLREQAEMFEKTFKQYPQNRYAFPALKKFEHLGPFAS